jgi:hypothetical protein
MVSKTVLWGGIFEQMPGGRRGLVAPQNTFLDNIIRYIKTIHCGRIPK